jgi:hypothetical protein
MKLKNVMSLLCAAMMTVGMGSGMITANAEGTEPYVGPNYFNDFQSYTTVDETGYDPMQLAGEWGNGWFDGVGDGTLDAACDPGDDYENWSIKTDPKNPDNKALYINCIPTTGSFIYFTLKDEESNLISTKNFEMSFDFLLQQGLANNGWLGLTLHKSADTRYNGCNNIMLTTRLWNQNSISSMMFRNLGMSGILVDPLTEDRSAPASSFPCPAGQDIYSQWYTFKLVANGEKFDAYVNDVHIGGADITKNPAKKFGYVSIVTCMTEVYIDNVRMTNNDTEAPPVVEDPVTPPPTTTVEPPVITGESSFTLDKGATTAVEVTLDTKGQTITKIEKDGVLVDARYYTYADGKLTLLAPYITGLANKAGEHNFVVTTAGGSVNFALNISDPSNDKAGGCNSSMTGIGVVSMLTMLGAVAVLRKRR